MIYAVPVFAVCVLILVIEMERNIRKSALLAWGSVKSLDISMNTLMRLRFCHHKMKSAHQSCHSWENTKISPFHNLWFCNLVLWILCEYIYLWYCNQFSIVTEHIWGMNDILLPKGPPLLLWCSPAPPHSRFTLPTTRGKMSLSAKDWWKGKGLYILKLCKLRVMT